MSHKAIITQVTKTEEIPGADKIQIAYVLGERVVVGKDVTEGYVGVLFPADLQLSEDFCHHNNLFRKAEKNKDPTKAGFFEESRRVRAQPFLKVRSEAYFTSLSSFDYTDLDMSVYPLGTQFDELSGYKFCQKYYSPATLKAKAGVGGNLNNLTAKKRFVHTPYFEKHVDSEQFRHFVGGIKEGSLIYFHAKVHGTSARMGYTLTNINYPPFYQQTLAHVRWGGKRHALSLPLPNLKYWANKIYPFFETQKWDYVVGTRNVVLAAPEKEGFHGSEKFRFDVMELVKPYLEKGMTIYGEIAGYANTRPIMAEHDAGATKNKGFEKKYGKQIVYRYGCKEHEYRFHIYRITMTNPEGKSIDFSQEQLNKWCANRSLLGPVEVHTPIRYNGDAEGLRKLVEELTERPECLGEDYIDPSHPGEGIILRVDSGNFTPKFYKNKAFFFRAMEGQIEAIDVEDAS